MKLTDIIPITLKKYGVDCAFGLQGGAVVHIFDSLERGGIKVIYPLHEQTASFAGSGYARSRSGLGCVVTTTGPGSTNAITGLLGAWNDSIPCIFISGQVRSNHVSYGKRVRQVGTQESPIRDIVDPITKGAVYLSQPENFQDELESLIQLALSGRPGPVWLDIPLEFQWQNVPFNKTQVEDVKFQKRVDLTTYNSFLAKSRSPLFVLGNGIHLSRTERECKSYIESLGVPFVTTWTGQDIFGTNHSLNLGVIGMSGQKGANKAIFDADLLVCLGTHLSIPQTTTLYDSYATGAKKIIINNDADQLKNLNIKFDLMLNEDLRDFFSCVESQGKIDIGAGEFSQGSTGMNCAKYQKLNWREFKQQGLPNSNVWNRSLTSKAPPKSAFVIDGGGTALYAGFQSTQIRYPGQQRVICLSGMSSMGTGLGETIGAFFSGKYERLYCIIGDGSFFMNVQDLQLIKQHSVPVVISVINNNGYLAIRHTQRDFQEGRYYGTHPKGGLTMPSTRKIAEAFNLDYRLVSNASDIEDIAKEVTSLLEPVVCEIVTSEDQNVLFKQKYKDNGDGTFSPLPLSEMDP